MLWLLSPSVSQTCLQNFGGHPRPKWPDGVYRFAKGLRTTIVALNELPLIQDTLWLRLLGKGSTQQQAISEVFNLPTHDPKRSTILQLLATWKITLDYTDDTEEEGETLMQLTQAYLEWEQRTKEQAKQEGRQEGQHLVLQNLLRIRFGDLDSSLTAIIPQLLSLPVEEYTSIVLQLSREELLERFSQTP
jgi:predicted transposase YdaD